MNDANQLGGRRPDGTIRWRTLSHQGVALPPPFEELPRAVGVPVIWRGKEISLKSSPEAEFYLSEFVRRGGVTRIPSSRAKGMLSASLFGSRAAAETFWRDWKELLPKGSPISSLEELDLSRVVNALLIEAKAKGKSDEKGNRKPRTISPHAQARVDGKLQPVAPSAVDRPGIFFGRSSDVTATMNGRIRRRVVAEDVTVNLGESARVPPVPKGCGKKWGAIVHDPTVDWIASWRDPVTSIVKYARLAISSESEQIGTKEKYDLAKKMIAITPVLRKKIAAALGSSDRKRRQLGAVLWLVDRLALRIGSGSALSAKRAGAHGVATLLVKHVEIVDRHTIRLSFPGKDCVRYERTVKGIPSELGHVLADAARRKSPEEALFDAVDSNNAARAIDSILPGATSKVLRTARASELFEATLDGIRTTDAHAAKLQLLFAFTRVAILLNHRKAAPKRRTRKRQSQATDLGGGDLAEIDRNVDDLMKEFANVRDKTDVARIGKKLREDVIRSANLSLATARASYIDPRLVVEFGRRANIADPGGAGFSKKFPWA